MAIDFKLKSDKFKNSKFMSGRSKAKTKSEVCKDSTRT